MGRGTRYLGEGHDGHETEREPQGSIPMQVVGEEAQRDEHEHHVQPGAKEKKPEGFYPARLVFRHAEEANDAFLVRGSAYMAVHTVAVLEEGCCIRRRHVGCGRLVVGVDWEGAWV